MESRKKLLLLTTPDPFLDSICEFPIVRLRSDDEFVVESSGIKYCYLRRVVMIRFTRARKGKQSKRTWFDILAKLVLDGTDMSVGLSRSKIKA